MSPPRRRPRPLAQGAQLVLADVERSDAQARKAQQKAEAEARRRKGGRPRKPAEERGLPHSPRPALKRRFPVHVTLRLVEGLPNLRKRRTFRVMRRVLRAAAIRFGQMFQIVEFSVQPNHVHLIVEAHDRRELSRGMQGLGIRVAKNLNLHFRRKGAALEDRYHAHILRTRAETAHALRYVRKNSAKHEQRRFRQKSLWLAPIDPCSTDAEHERRVLPACRTWLLSRALRDTYPDDTAAAHRDKRAPGAEPLGARPRLARRPA